MGLIDDIGQGFIDALTNKADNWRDRRGDNTIAMVSPESGKEFKARWKSGPRKLDKKIGLFSYPNIQGTIAQDLNVDSDRHSFTFWFEGKNCDLLARDFYFIAAKERGQWTVTHPIYGLLGLQLLSLSEEQNNREGNFVEISSDWIESIDPFTLETKREMLGIVDGQCSIVQLNAIEQFVETCDQSSKYLRSVVEDTVTGIENATRFVLSPIFAANNLVNSAMTSAHRLITGSMAAVLLPLAELGAQIQDTCNLPLLAATDSKNRLNKYSELVATVAALMPGNPSSVTPTWASARAKRNNIAVAELAIVSSLVANTQIVLTADDIQTRPQAVSISTRIIEAFSDATNTLDAQQTALETALINDQYFSHSTVYNELLKLVSLTANYLLQQAAGLKIERRFELEKPRSPLEICLTEYGTLDDYDMFLETNDLHGPDILLLPAGREVAVYV